MSDAIKLLEGKEDDVNLSEIESLLNQLADKKKAYEEDEEKLKKAKAEIDRLEMQLIPEKMGGLTQIKVRVGSQIATVNVKRILRANISKDNKPQAYAWIESKGGGDLIKTEVSSSFGRGELELAKKIQEVLKTQFSVEASLDQTIHWSTLDSWVKEQLDRGMEFPPIIGIFEGKKAEVKYGK